MVFPNHSFPKRTNLSDKTQIAHEIVVSHRRTCANKQQKNLRKKKNNQQRRGQGLDYKHFGKYLQRTQLTVGQVGDVSVLPALSVQQENDFKGVMSRSENSTQHLYPNCYVPDNYLPI